MDDFYYKILATIALAVICLGQVLMIIILDFHLSKLVKRFTDAAAAVKKMAKLGE